MNKFNRYNQGFGKFGPMEQCKEGKWTLASDYLILLITAQNRRKHISKLESNVRVIQHQVNSLESSLSSEIAHTERLTKLLDKKRNIISDLAMLTVVLAVANIAQFVAGMV